MLLKPLLFGPAVYARRYALHKECSLVLQSGSNLRNYMGMLENKQDNDVHKNNCLIQIVFAVAVAV